MKIGISEGEKFTCSNESGESCYRNKALKEMSQVEQLTQKCQELEAKLRESERLAFQLQTNLSDKKADLTNAQQQVETQEAEITRLKEQLAEKDQDLTKMNEQLQENIEIMVNSTGRFGMAVEKGTDEDAPMIDRWTQTVVDDEFEEEDEDDTRSRSAQESISRFAMNVHNYGGDTDEEDGVISEDSEGGAARPQPNLRLHLPFNLNNRHDDREENSSFNMRPDDTPRMSCLRLNQPMPLYSARRETGTTARDMITARGDRTFRDTIREQIPTGRLRSTTTTRIEATPRPWLSVGGSQAAAASPAQESKTATEKETTAEKLETESGVETHSNNNTQTGSLDQTRDHMFTIDDGLLNHCTTCSLMEQVQQMYSGKMVSRESYFAVGWIPEMCQRWATEHQFVWTLEERMMVATVLTERPLLEQVQGTFEGHAFIWRDRAFWRSPWKPAYFVLQGVFLYVFPSNKPRESLLGVMPVRSCTAEAKRAVDGKDYVVKVTSLGCTNCVGAEPVDSIENISLAFDSGAAMAVFQKAISQAQSTCPHMCSGKFSEETNAFREIIECLLASDTAKGGPQDQV